MRYAEDLYVVSTCGFNSRAISDADNPQGYKHYVHRDIKPQFAFGYALQLSNQSRTTNTTLSHGLSYTTFCLSDLKVAEPKPDPLSVAITVRIKNTGSVAGAEVAQAYLSYPTASTSLSKFLRESLSACD